MAGILITTQPANQVVAGGGSPLAFAVVADYDGVETLLYQWYSCDADGGNAEAIVDADADEYTPAAIGVGEKAYFYCELDATDVDEPVVSEVVFMQQNGTVPLEIPEYVTGEFVHEYIAQTSLEVQQRFVSEQARTGIEIEDTDVPLRSMQLELFYSII